MTHWRGKTVDHAEMRRELDLGAMAENTLFRYGTRGGGIKLGQVALICTDNVTTSQTLALFKNKVYKSLH
jgi:hypothetical protein